MCGNDAPPFPSMHVAHAAIAMWFCRRWTRISKLLLIYNVVLVPVILLLEWHYLVDILGGIWELLSVRISLVPVVCIAAGVARGAQIAPSRTLFGMAREYSCVRFDVMTRSRDGSMESSLMAAQAQCAAAVGDDQELSLARVGAMTGAAANAVFEETDARVVLRHGAQHVDHVRRRSVAGYSASTGDGRDVYRAGRRCVALQR